MRVTLRWWEIALLAPPALLAGLFLVGGHVPAGVVLAALTLVLVASRATIRERNVPGGYATTRAMLGLLKTIAFFVIYGVILVFMIVAQRDDWSNDTRGSVAIYAMGGLAFFLLRDMNRLTNEAFDWLRGGDMERRVARELDELRDEDWLITHDLRMDSGGNLDHFITGRNGALAVETKSGRSTAAARTQAIRNAVWAKEKFGQRYVTAVLCVGTDPPPRPVKHPNVWVMGPDDLRDFVRAYTGRS